MIKSMKHLDNLHQKRKLVLANYTLATGIALILILSCKPQGESKDPRLEQKIDSLLSWDSLRIADLEEKLNYIDIAKSMANEAKSHELLGDVYIKEAEVYKSDFQFSKATNSLELAEKQYRKANCTKKRARVLTHIAFSYSHLGELDKALEICNKGIGIYKENDDPEIGCRFYNQKGHIYNILHENEKTKDLYEEALKLSYRTKNSHLISRCINDLGNINNSMGNDSLALELYKKSIEAAHDSASLLRYYNNIGDIFLKQKDSAKAILYLRKAQKFQTSKRKEYTVYCSLGEHFLSTKQYDSSVFYLNKALNYMKNTRFKHEFLYVRQLLCQAYLNTNEPLKAYKELEICMDIQKDMFGFQKGIAVSKVENQLQEIKREQKIDRYHFAGLFFSIIIGILALAIAYRFKHFKRSLSKAEMHNMELQQENGIIKEDLLSKEKELVTFSLKLAQNEYSKESMINQITSIKKNANADTSKYLDCMLSNIKGETSNENLWNEFEIRFNHANDQFYKRLISKHPNLSKSEKKLCAFLKLNLNTKEISLLTGQNANSIFVARTRLRKKLNLSNSKIELSDYLLNL